MALALARCAGRLARAKGWFCSFSGLVGERFLIVLAYSTRRRMARDIIDRTWTHPGRLYQRWAAP